MIIRAEGVAEEDVVTAESKGEIVVRTDVKRDVKTGTTTVSKI
jgi:predicted RNA-binding protein